MRIQIDARILFGGGIGRYLREIAGRWLADPSVEALRFAGRPGELEPWLSEVDARGIASVRRWEGGSYAPSAQSAALAGTLERGWDVTFFPHYDVPLLRCPTPAVVTVHDLIHFQAPEGFPAWKRLAGAALLRGAVRRAARIVAISQATADALAAFAPGSAGKTSVVHNGISGAFLPPFSPDHPDTESRFGALRPFVMTLARDKAHKNLALAVDALAAARGAGELKLLLAGVGERLSPGLARRVAAAGVSGRVVPLASPSDAELRWLYRNTVAFLWPSRVEGFGLPPLEALACGAPVLAADIPASRECLEGFADLLPLGAPVAWGSAIEAALLRGRDRTVSRTDVLARFSWGRAAAGTLTILRDAARMA